VEPTRPPTLGQLVLQHGLISEADLESALAEHFASGRRLGEILVEKGHLDTDALEALLEEQLRLRADAGRPEPTREAETRGIDLLREQLAAAEAELTRHRPAAARQTGVGEEEKELHPAEPAGAEPRIVVPTGPAVSTPSGEPSDGAFVLFVPTPAGYQLLERSGPVPAVGDEVGVSSGLLVVAKVGVSPLPGDLRRCAYLEAPA
jgi:hypothetical protein